MLEYVKICPKCGQANSEFSDICGNDGEFLGMIEPIPKHKESSASPAPPMEQSGQTQAGSTAQNESAQEKERVTNRFENASAFYLEIPGTDQVYTIKNGFVLGQAEPTSDADVQLSGIPEINFVHRRHCLFDYAENKWHVTAIKNEGFTNPTLVNHVKLQPGQRHALNNGDRLILSSITLNVRII
jgi:hypothetical protein